MEYLLLFMFGYVVNRYILPVLDIFIELVNYWLTKFASKIVIETQREQYLFKKEVESDKSDPSAIGFHYEHGDCCECLDEDEEDYDDEFDEEENFDEKSDNDLKSSLSKNLKKNKLKLTTKSKSKVISRYKRTVKNNKKNQIGFNR